MQFNYSKLGKYCQLRKRRYKLVGIDYITRQSKQARIVPTIEHNKATGMAYNNFLTLV